MQAGGTCLNNLKLCFDLNIIGSFTSVLETQSSRNEPYVCGWLNAIIIPIFCPFHKT